MVDFASKSTYALVLGKIQAVLSHMGEIKVIFLLAVWAFESFFAFSNGLILDPKGRS